MGQSRPHNEVLLNAADTTTNPVSASPYVDCSYFIQCSFQVNVTGAPQGVFATLFSNDLGLPPGISTFSSGPVLTISAPGQYFIQSIPMSYRWLACEFTSTGGSGLITVKANATGSY